MLTKQTSVSPALYRLPKGKPRWVTEHGESEIKAMALPEYFGKVIASTVKKRTVQRKTFEAFDKPENISS